jgi:transposase InsO family protein
VYLATVLDCFSKKAVGYAMADHMRTSLVTDALSMAVRNGLFNLEVGVSATRQSTG